MCCSRFIQSASLTEVGQMRHEGVNVMWSLIQSVLSEELHHESFTPPETINTRNRVSGSEASLTSSSSQSQNCKHPKYLHENIRDKKSFLLTLLSKLYFFTSFHSDCSSQRVFTFPSLQLESLMSPAADTEPIISSLDLWDLTHLTAV